MYRTKTRLNYPGKCNISYANHNRDKSFNEKVRKLNNRK